MPTDVETSKAASSATGSVIGGRMTGQRAVVVGASHGIGEAVAAAFAGRGADVLITGRSAGRLGAAAARIADGQERAGGGQPGAGAQVQAQELDATDEPAVGRLFSGLEPFDHLVLVASPGPVGFGPLAGLDQATLRAAFDGKFFAYVNVLRAARPRASVTMITAASARAAYPGSSGLAAVNGALESMVRPLAVELAPLRVNAVSPGVIDTPWWDAMPADQRAAFMAGAAASAPVGRVGRAADVAAAVLYLAGSDFITGTVLDVTGGAILTAGGAG